MSYPTTLNYGATTIIGAQPINQTSTNKNHVVGTICRATDQTYGEGEFIYLPGVASTVAGSAVVYDDKAGTTTLTVAASKGPVAIAMSANVASQYGWYQISGAAVVSSASATSGSMAGTSATAGTLGNTTTGQQVSGMRYSSAQDAPGTGFTVVQMSHPSANGLG